MFIRPCFKKSKGKKLAYWALVESYRTPRGPRQRVIAYLGQIGDEDILDAKAAGLKYAATNQSQPKFVQTRFEFDDDTTQPDWVEVNIGGLSVENKKHFGGPWIAMELIRLLQLDTFLKTCFPQGDEVVPWYLVSQILVICRLLNPSSELYIAEHFYKSTALPDMLGIPADQIYDNRLYRALDRLLPHKDELEKHLKNQLGTLFDVEYDLLLYDVTSTYFEGQCNSNPLAQRGYSRDHRGDCKQICIGLVVTKSGIPIGYEVFKGNTHDSKTYQFIVETMEKKYGKADRIWCTDRGMMSEANIKFMHAGDRKYIIGVAKATLKKFEKEIADTKDWKHVREDVEVKMVSTPDGKETYVLCRSASRTEKEKAMHAKFEKRIEDELAKVRTSCEKRKNKKEVIDRRIGRIMQKNSRAAGLFTVDTKETDGHTVVSWTKKTDWQDWATLSEGCYLLRTNVTDLTPEELWKAYIQLTEAEEAFRIQKNDLCIRPIWHQKEERVLSHVLVCFLAYVLWKTLGEMVKSVGLGDEPRRVLDELSEIVLVDIVLPTRDGPTIRRRCIAKPTEHQKILIDRLGLNLPKRFKNYF